VRSNSRTATPARSRWAIRALRPRSGSRADTGCGPVARHAKHVRGPAAAQSDPLRLGLRPQPRSDLYKERINRHLLGKPTVEVAGGAQAMDRMIDLSAQRFGRGCGDIVAQLHLHGGL